MDSAIDSAAVFRRRLARSGFGLFFLLAAFCVAWGVDSALNANVVSRNVSVQGIDLGGMTAEQVREMSEGLTSSLRDEPVTISIADRTLTTDLVRLGVRVDHAQLLSDAFAARTGGSFLGGPFRWLGSFTTPVEIDMPYIVDGPSIDAAVDGFIAPQMDGPTQPNLALGGTQFVALPGTAGTVVDPAELAERVVRVTGTTGPYSFSLTPFPQSPDLALDDIGRVALELNEATGDPLDVAVLDQTTQLTPDELRSLIDIENTDEGAFWQVNQGRALDLLRDRFEGLGDASQQARFIVVQDQPEIVPADQTLVCCDDKTAALLRAALLTRPAVPVNEEGEDPEVPEGEETGGTPIRSVELSPIVTDGDKGVAELEALGITELVSTFTTDYECCQNRVVNIQLFADTVRGTVIRPGEVLSLNELVGRRTPEKGYKQAGAINLGSLEPQYGGGVSQAITTIFNAAFFAGLDFDEYQSHSLYFSRYPEGREATISFPRPDLKLRNDTEYGVLIWTEHTSTSVTVSMYSTKHIEVEALPVVRRAQGKCRRVITPRVRTYANGQVKRDEVFAVYRPAQGLNCQGEPADPEARAAAAAPAPAPTVPPTTAAPTTTAPAPTTAAPTTAPPTTAPPVTTAATTTPTTVAPPPTEPTVATDG